MRCLCAMPLLALLACGDVSMSGIESDLAAGAGGTSSLQTGGAGGFTAGAGQGGAAGMTPENPAGSAGTGGTGAAGSKSPGAGAAGASGGGSGPGGSTSVGGSLSGGSGGDPTGGTNVGGGATAAGTSGGGGSGQGGASNPFGQGGSASTDEGGAAGVGPGGSAGAAGAVDNSANTDSDGDGWTPAQGDCCDRVDDCVGVSPALVNPGAYEVTGNGLDDDCDGLPDAVASCDDGLPSSMGDTDAMGRALGLCRAVADADPPPSRRWGVLDARLLRADGSPLQDLRAATVRPRFGAITPREGKSLLVLSTGIAADGKQTDPGPNGGTPASSLLSSKHSPDSLVSLTKPAADGALSDWFATERAPIKQAGSLPLLPGCPGQSSSDAYDSVTLRLKLRVPTNARSVRLRVRWMSSEFPASVCTSFNDQFLALLPAADHGNGPDHNLLVYRDAQGTDWPASLPLARTPLLSHCDLPASKCWTKNSSISPSACSLGPKELAGTGLEAPTGDPCSHGASTDWLTVSGNVAPGQTADLRLSLWDVGDSQFDSIALIDDVQWGPDAVVAGTTP